jgi:hypothetical protein
MRVVGGNRMGRHVSFSYSPLPKFVSNTKPAVCGKKIAIQPQTVLSTRESGAGLRTQSNSSPRGRDTSRCGKSLCISPALRPRRRPDKLIRECCAKVLERQLETKGRRALPNRQFARASRTPARNAAVKFLIGCAGVDLHMFVANAPSDVAAKLIAAEPAARVSVIEANFAAGPRERRFFRGQ